MQPTPTGVDAAKAMTDCLLHAAKLGGQGTTAEDTKDFRGKFHSNIHANTTGIVQDLAADQNRLCGVELHAHINGSISPQLINELIERKNNFRAAYEKEKRSRLAGNGAEATHHDKASPSTLAATQMLPNSDTCLTEITDPKERMAYCFTIFDTIYKVMDNLESTQKAVEDVLLSYAVEDVKYLELRTSLREMKYFEDDLQNFDFVDGKEVPLALAPREKYVDVVWKTIQRLQDQEDGVGEDVDPKTGRSQFPSNEGLSRWYKISTSQRSNRGLPCAGGGRKPTVLESLPSFITEIKKRLKAMTVKLMLSVNRGAPVAVAEETVDLAILFAKQHPSGNTKGNGASANVDASRGKRDREIAEVKETEKTPKLQLVGVDLGGNCYKGVFSELLPALNKGRAHGFKMSLHAGEKKDDAEFQEILDFNPERYGHVCYMSPEHEAELIARKSPIEFCITSNMLTSGYESPLEHHLDRWFFEAKAEEVRWQAVLQCASKCKQKKSGADSTDAKTLNARIQEYLFHAKSGVPISINTDDRGVFYTSLFQEHLFFCCIAANGFQNRVKKVQSQLIDQRPEAAAAEEQSGDELKPTAFATATAKKHLSGRVEGNHIAKWIRNVMQEMYTDSVNQGF